VFFLLLVHEGAVLLVVPEFLALEATNLLLGKTGSLAGIIASVLVTLVTLLVRQLMLFEFSSRLFALRMPGLREGLLCSSVHFSVPLFMSILMSLLYSTPTLSPGVLPKTFPPSLKLFPVGLPAVVAVDCVSDILSFVPVEPPPYDLEELLHESHCSQSHNGHLFELLWEC
jgi:hypothetical protein